MLSASVKYLTVCLLQVSVQGGGDEAVSKDHAPGAQQDARRRD